MNKLKLLSWKDAQPTFYQLYWQSSLNPYFDLVWLDDQPTGHSSKNSIVIIRPYIDGWQEKITQYQAQGFKVILEDLWELPIDSIIDNNVLTLRSKNFFRINESLWWHYLNFDQYVPTGQKSKKFLLLMRMRKTHRDRVYRNLNSILDQSVYSYVDRGKTLASDIAETNPNWQRHFDPAWYDSTYFSVVAETLMQTPTFVTEKTYKPIAYYHPFVVVGSAGTLAHVRDQGFETFSHIIDESYDFEQDNTQRLMQVCDIVFDLTKQLEKNSMLFQDSLTQQKLQHNHNTFFNRSLVEKLFCDDILTQILNFVEAP
jgi:hypothetical protein